MEHCVSFHGTSWGPPICLCVFFGTLHIHSIWTLSLVILVIEYQCCTKREPLSKINQFYSALVINKTYSQLITILHDNYRLYMISAFLLALCDTYFIGELLLEYITPLQSLTFAIFDKHSLCTKGINQA